MKIVNMDRKNNSVVLNLNTKIYKADAVLRVAQIFTEICRVDVNGDASGILKVMLKPKTKEIGNKKIGYEFMNHILAEMKISEDD